MRTSTFERKYLIQQTGFTQLDDLHFADDLTLLSHTHQQMQMNTTNVAAEFRSVGLNIHTVNSKILKYNTE
ncbi:unnamed protein product [Schistosoma margrebowiei]|uniref:Uncharacterized protein n=1 Tax=Schistosoma margrebowiei TaxID=48269 RepID=A0A183LDN3_9TREM|nr:unnamed protein product [Schistosoma margrebowiei]